MCLDPEHVGASRVFQGLSGTSVGSEEAEYTRVGRREWELVSDMSCGKEHCLFLKGKNF